MASSTTKFFFAYGSTISQSDMRSRCPHNSFYSIAVLRNHRWFVNERGYANIAPSAASAGLGGDVVWGVLYRLRPFDEDLLDKSEGLPWSYSKVDMDIEAVTISEDGRGTKREMVTAVVYIDRERVQDSNPYPDFVTKMNKGIDEGIERGIPRTWFDRVVRGYLILSDEDEPLPNGIPSKTTNEGDKSSSAASAKAPSVADSRSAESRAQPASAISLLNASQDARRPRGLGDSIYAQQSDTIGELPASSAVPSHKAGPVAGNFNTTTAAGRSKKQSTCWWWKTQGSCRFTEEQCQFSHRDTGNPVVPPGGKKYFDTVNRTSTLASKKSRQPHTAFNKPDSHSYGQDHERASSQQIGSAPNSSWDVAAADDEGWGGRVTNNAVIDDSPWGDEGGAQLARNGGRSAATKTPGKSKTTGLSWADDEPPKETSKMTESAHAWNPPIDDRDEQW